jgi:hypothetical protein
MYKWHDVLTSVNRFNPGGPSCRRNRFLVVIMGDLHRRSHAEHRGAGGGIFRPKSEAFYHSRLVRIDPAAGSGTLSVSWQGSTRRSHGRSFWPRLEKGFRHPERLGHGALKDRFPRRHSARGGHDPLFTLGILERQQRGFRGS